MITLPKMAQNKKMVDTAFPFPENQLGESPYEPHYPHKLIGKARFARKKNRKRPFLYTLVTKRELLGIAQRRTRLRNAGR
jgi:hypothetical protein